MRFILYLNYFYVFNWPFKLYTILKSTEVQFLCLKKNCTCKPVKKVETNKIVELFYESGEKKRRKQFGVCWGQSVTSFRARNPEKLLLSFVHSFQVKYHLLFKDQRKYDLWMPTWTYSSLSGFSNYIITKMIRKQNSMRFNHLGRMFIPSDSEPQKIRPDHVIKLVTPGNSTEDQVTMPLICNRFNLIIIRLDPFDNSMDQRKCSFAGKWNNYFY